MTTVEEFAESFPSEQVLQQALAKLLSKVPNHTGVQILQGPAEIGKDIIFYTPAAFGQKVLNACVVKNTKITGNASTSAGARTVFNQAQQVLDTPFLDENGHEHRVKKVFIITPHPIPPQTTSSIVGALRASNDQVQFLSGSALFELFKTHWPEYLSEEFKLIHAYADALIENTERAKELAGLSFQYQLGVVETSIKRVYVQPKFHRFVRAYSLTPLYESIPNPLEFRSYSDSFVQTFQRRVKNIDAFIKTLMDWEMCSSTEGVNACSAWDELLDALTKSWSKALARRAATASSGAAAEMFSARLGNVTELNNLLESAKKKSHEALKGIQEKLEWTGICEERALSIRNAVSYRA